MTLAQKSTDVNAIALVNRELENAMRDGNSVRLTAIYSKTGQLLPPNGTIISGLENINNYWQNVLDTGITDANLTTEELDLLGNTAIEIGSYVMKKGEDVADVGKYLVVWKSENGDWKYHRDIWNSDLAI